MFGYKLQGLLVASNCALPALASLESDATPDVVFRAGSLPADLDAERLQEAEPTYSSPHRAPGGKPYSRMWRCRQSGRYYFHFLEGFSFVVDSAGENIWAQWPDHVTIEDITAFLLGRILAFVLHLRGFTCLHASAIALDGGAVLFAGNPGVGKSSTAAAFAERGHPVLTDDVSAIQRAVGGKIVVMPGIPRVCLCPDSVDFLYGQDVAEQLPLLHPQEDKRLVRLDAAPGKFQCDPLPLKAIYLLAPRSEDASAPLIAEVAGADRLIRLLYNGFMHLTLGREQLAHEFGILGEIASGALIRQLVPSKDPGKIGRLCELVVTDVRSAQPLTIATKGS